MLPFFKIAISQKIKTELLQNQVILEVYYIL